MTESDEIVVSELGPVSVQNPATQSRTQQIIVGLINSIVSTNSVKVITNWGYNGEGCPIYRLIIITILCTYVYVRLIEFPLMAICLTKFNTVFNDDYVIS